MAAIGKHSTLTVTRQHPKGSGLYLDGGDLGEILFPQRYVTDEIAGRRELDVFVYLDSEDRLVATTEVPLATVGEFGLLQVASVHQQVGAFLDWGLMKDLLLPFREQDSPVTTGQQLVVYVMVDAKTDRIVATSRLKRHLNRTEPHYGTGQPVDLLVLDETPLGYSAIVDNAHTGLLYRDDLPGPLEHGHKHKGFIKSLRPDGKIDLSLDPTGYTRIAPLTDQILAVLEENGGTLDFDDKSPPDAIRETFGTSKKAFKQALGALYKDRRITLEKPGIRLAGGVPLPYEKKSL